MSKVCQNLAVTFFFLSAAFRILFPLRFSCFCFVCDIFALSLLFVLPAESADCAHEIINVTTTVNTFSPAFTGCLATFAALGVWTAHLQEGEFAVRG
jgi:hypothetical protein